MANPTTVPSPPVRARPGVGWASGAAVRGRACARHAVTAAGAGASTSGLAILRQPGARRGLSTVLWRFRRRLDDAMVAGWSANPLVAGDGFGVRDADWIPATRGICRPAEEHGRSILTHRPISKSEAEDPAIRSPATRDRLRGSCHQRSSFMATGPFRVRSTLLINARPTLCPARH
jgi:hypothetical protein